MSENIKENLSAIKTRISDTCARCGRDPIEITLVAISKTKPLQDILTARETGQLHYGENRAKEIEDKMDQASDSDLIWHFVGTLQTNKIKYMTHRVNWIHSVWKKKYLNEIENRAGQHNRVIDTLIQVNISKEDQKSGCEPDEIEGILKYAKNLKHVRVRGLMGMATFTDNPEDVRLEFRLLKELQKKFESLNGGAVNLEHLSMGMSNDMEVAIEEGATMIRVGSSIFGER
jgi:pyridoxal phosphate enzyme (YggS family)